MVPRESEIHFPKILITLFVTCLRHVTGNIENQLKMKWKIELT